LENENNAVCILISKDQIEQKEEVNILLSLEKEKFDKEFQMSEDETEYQSEYNKIFGDNQEIEDIIRQKERY
jgi:hypothetical protein